MIEIQLEEHPLLEKRMNNAKEESKSLTAQCLQFQNDIDKNHRELCACDPRPFIKRRKALIKESTHLDIAVYHLGVRAHFILHIHKHYWI